jgi:hypothetical protein
MSIELIERKGIKGFIKMRPDKSDDAIVTVHYARKQKVLMKVIMSFSISFIKSEIKIGKLM